MAALSGLNHAMAVMSWLRDGARARMLIAL
jgi:hypothetical protein